jgi:hypothetical protein
MTRARAPTASARRIASASGRSAGIGTARLASPRALSAGSRARIFAPRTACPDCTQMNAAMITSHSRL